jgi:WD40 repeat protein
MDSSLVLNLSKLRPKETKTSLELNESLNKSLSHSTNVTIITPQIVNCVEFSPYEWTHYLLAFECNSRLSVIKLLFSEQTFDSNFDYELIEEFVIGVKCSSIGFSPETNLEVLQKCVKLAIATYDYDIRLISSHFKSIEPNVNYVSLREHSDFVNDIAFDAMNGLSMASVSDDCSCCLWTINGSSAELSAKLTLTSPGVSVKWHSSEPNKVFNNIYIYFKSIHYFDYNYLSFNSY